MGIKELKLKEKKKEALNEFRKIRNKAKQEYNKIVKPAWNNYFKKIEELENDNKIE